LNWKQLDSLVGVAHFVSSGYRRHSTTLCQACICECRVDIADVLNLLVEVINVEL